MLEGVTEKFLFAETKRSQRKYGPMIPLMISS